MVGSGRYRKANDQDSGFFVEGAKLESDASDNHGVLLVATVFNSSVLVSMVN